MKGTAPFSHKTDEWQTPKNIYNFYMKCNAFDPCPIDHKEDGLKINWKKFNFVNPPYSKISKWVDKALEELEKGNDTDMLIPARTDTKYFKKLWDAKAIFIFIEGRLHFNESKSAPFPSMIVLLRKTDNPMLGIFRMHFLTKKEQEIFWK